jgi:phosphatidylserine/phosphatidylglycerophosphate/cardiolipin synthase-like enzyme
MKKFIAIVVLVILAFFGYYIDFDLDGMTSAVTVDIPETYISDNGEIEVIMCPHQDCEGKLLEFIDSASESLHCAFFEVDLDKIRDKLLEKSAEIEVKVITDDKYLYEFDHSFVRVDRSGLMHNKFCIVDGVKVSSGSMNPTDNGAFKNNNNLLLIESSTLASNYEAEFQEMWNGTFKKGNSVLNPLVEVSGIKVENYFCPEDNCASHVKDVLENAKESIHFMTFSFTDDSIANVLLLKNLDGVSVKGVMEARQVTKYSVFELLSYQEIDVVKDSNKANMHHKVFIVDSSIVITGSYNPTGNGNKGNDENVLIIYSEEIGRLFEEEFSSLRS